ncbi:unnamed protein product [Amoebophrya sp. A120]|nr:unnamed protein product [Amoebophrya sp. A120]|eukprot:GSA120T00008298001.1
MFSNKKSFSSVVKNPLNKFRTHVNSYLQRFHRTRKVVLQSRIALCLSQLMRSVLRSSYSYFFCLSTFVLPRYVRPRRCLTLKPFFQTLTQKTGTSTPRTVFVRPNIQII